MYESRRCLESPSPHSSSTALTKPFSRSVGALATRAERSDPSRASTVRGSLGSILRVQWMVVAKRLAPVGHRETRLGLLRELKFGDRLFPAEAVEDGHTAQEMPLRFRRSGCRE